MRIPAAIKAFRETYPILALKIELLPIRGRTKRILMAYASGFTYKEIGEHYNISKQRVATVCKALKQREGLTAIFCTPAIEL